MTIERLLSEINMSETYAPKVLEAYEKWIQTDTPSEERAKALLGEPRTFADAEKAMALLLYVAVEERNHGTWSRFPEETFIKTMLVFTRSVAFAKEATGVEKYMKGPWPLIHATARWFRIGELEFELNEDNGQHEVHIHIPAGAKLTAEALYETFVTEEKFMKEYLPEWANVTHACESWMMSPKLKEILPENSKILFFQSLFNIVGYTPTLRWVLEFVFKLEVIQHDSVKLEDLREDTSLQRDMKKYILAGGDPGEGRGVLDWGRVRALKQ